MMILKCKMCGGNIEITGESHGVCDSCGCEVTRQSWMMTGERRCITGEIISAAGENLIRHILLMNIS